MVNEIKIVLINILHYAVNKTFMIYLFVLCSRAIFSHCAQEFPACASWFEQFRFMILFLNASSFIFGGTRASNRLELANIWAKLITLLHDEAGLIRDFKVAHSFCAQLRCTAMCVVFQDKTIFADKTRRLLFALCSNLK